MTTQRLTTGDFGLDLVLGDGIATLARLPDRDPSASILIRGGPGAGKTLLGSQLAIVLANDRGGDVAYACVELLPSELHAQLDSVWPTANEKAPVARLVQDAVANRFRAPPFGKKSSGIHSDLYASTLPLPAGKELHEFGAAIEGLLSAIERSGGSPSVLVIDSLARGYGLADAPRIFADSLVKLAVERGLVLILLEESRIPDTTEWAYAMDVVLELEHVDRSSSAAAQMERRLWVMKNRFGPSTPGPHRFSILEGHGVQVYPSEVTYATPWGRRVGSDWNVADRGARWGIPMVEDAARGRGWAPPTSAVLFVRGGDSDLVRMAAALLLPQDEGADVWVHFGDRLNPTTPTVLQQHDVAIGLGYPMLSPPRLMHTVTDMLGRLTLANRTIGRVLIGDLAALDLFYGADDLRRAIAILLSVLDDAGVPVVLFETAGPTMALLSTSGDPMRYESEGERPKLLDWADTVADVLWGEGVHHGPLLRVTERASARALTVLFDHDVARTLWMRRQRQHDQTS